MSFRRLAVASMMAAATLAAATDDASAADVADCPGVGAPAVLVGRVPFAALEGVTVDGRGRLYTTDLVSGQVFRLDAPGSPAVPIAKVPGTLQNAGALAWHPDGRLLVGYGMNPWFGDAARNGSIAKLDIDTGRLTPFVTGGLSAANGIDVAADGTIYATNDFGGLIGRVSPTGEVDGDWAVFPSANGAVLSRDDSTLFVSRSFVDPGMSAVPVEDPGAPQSWAEFDGQDALAVADGLTLDSTDRPVVPMNLSGDMYRFDAPHQYCRIGSAPPGSSVLSYGRGDRGFSKGRLFRAGFDGTIYEIPGGFDASAEAAHP